ncbi:MAG: autotransporter domain-containing protein [Rhodospirillales bacterium]|nr:autotransporter domain-containing protein [Rhodospirillales bacterium]
MSNVISGTGTVTQIGAGTTSLTGANSYSGTTTISAGTLSVGAGGAAGTLGTGAVINDATLQLNRSDSITVANAVSGTGALTKLGAGVVTLTGANTYSGTTTISVGTLNVGGAGAVGTLGAGAVVNNATLLIDRSDAAFTLANSISGTGALTKSAAGTASTLTLTGTNSYSGTTTITEGILQIGAGGTTGTLGTGGVVTTGGTLRFNRSDALSVSGVISGSGTVSQFGNGTTSLTGANTYTGATTITTGALNIQNNTALGTTAAGTTVSSGAALEIQNNVTVGAEALSLTGTGIASGGALRNVSGDNTYGGAITLSGGATRINSDAGTLTLNGAIGGAAQNVTLGGAGNATIGGIIGTTTGTLTKDGVGTATLTGANTYTGATTISAGALNIQNNTALGTTAGGVTVASGAALEMQGGIAVGTEALSLSGLGVSNGGALRSISGTNSYAGAITLTGGGAGISSDAGTLTVSGVISGLGQTLTVGGAGTTVLTAANTYSGTTTISAGTLSIGNNTTTGTLGSGAVVNNGTLQIDRSNALTVANDISGSGALTKLQANALTLTGNNSYSGTTTISAGTLNVGVGGTAGSLGTGAVVNNGSLVFNRSDTLTVNGAISGSGSLTQAGTGKTILAAGLNGYTGTTTISAGQLQIGNGSTSGTVTGNIVNNAVLDFDLPNATTYSGVISGTGSVTQSGTGTLTLTGINTYAGPTTVSNGRLAVNGSIASNVTVASAGNLGGSGSINGGVTNNGMLAPGNSIGTLTVNGSYTQAAGSSYEVEVNAGGQADRLNVTGAPGTATINGGTVSVVAAAGVYSPSTTYTILNATGGVTGTYSNVTSNFPFLQASLGYDTNNIYLTLRPGGFARGALTFNQAAVGGVLDQSVAGSSGDFATVIGTMSTLTLAQGQAAMDAISGQNYAGFGTANIGSGLLFMNAIGQQMSLARGGSGSGTRVALAQACDIACDAQDGGEQPSPWSLWGNALGGTGSVSGNGNASTLTYNAGGMATGIDYRVDPRFLVGFGLGYASGNQWLGGFLGRGTTDSYQASVYASFAEAAYYIDAMAGYGYNDNQMTRQIVIPGLQSRTARGRTGANQFLAQAEAGYKIAVHAPAAATLAPFARLQTSAATQAGFSEIGADSLNLNVAPQMTTSVRGTLGAEISATVDAGWRDKLAMQLRLGWVHEYADTSRPVTAGFAGAPGTNFTVFGAAPPRDSAVLGFAASTAVAQNTSLYLRYDGEVGTGADNHALSAGIRLSW